MSDTALEYGGGAKDIMGDYPELFQKLKLDEVGYISGKNCPDLF